MSLLDLFKDNEAAFTDCYYSSAFNFEKRTGVTGVHTPWIMPEGIPHEKIEKKVHPDCFRLIGETPDTAPKDSFARVQTLFDEIVSLNPELKRIEHTRNDPDKLAHAVLGAIYKFNVDDISHFTSTTGEERRSNTNLIRKSNIISVRTGGAGLGWMPSEKTLDNMVRQLDVHTVYKDRQLTDKAKASPSLNEFSLGNRILMDGEGRIIKGPYDMFVDEVGDPITKKMDSTTAPRLAETQNSAEGSTMPTRTRPQMNYQGRRGNIGSLKTLKMAEPSAPESSAAPAVQRTPMLRQTTNSL